MQTEATTTYLYTPAGTAEAKPWSYCTLTGIWRTWRPHTRPWVWNSATTLETVRQFLQEARVHLARDPGVWLTGFYPREQNADVYTRTWTLMFTDFIYGFRAFIIGFICNGPKSENSVNVHQQIHRWRTYGASMWWNISRKYKRKACWCAVHGRTSSPSSQGQEAGPASIQTTRFHLLKILETQVQRQRQKGHLRLPARGAAEARAGEITPARGHVGVILCSHTHLSGLAVSQVNTCQNMSLHYMKLLFQL